MDEFINNIKKILYYPKLSEIDRNIPLKIPVGYQLLELINKLLIGYKYYLYYPKHTIIMHGNDMVTYNLPYYDNNQINNLDVSKFITNNNCIVPLFIKQSSVVGHYICFIINFKNKHVLFYDPLGINNDTKSVKKIIKKMLIDGNIVSKQYNFVCFNCPIQKYVKDDNNPWFYEMSCGIILSVFIYLYFLLDGDGLFEYLIKFCKSIKKKYINEFKDLLLFCYIALVEKYY
jgi:hypothetical protein